MSACTPETLILPGAGVSGGGPTGVPEPPSMVLFGSGLLLFFARTIPPFAYIRYASLKGELASSRQAGKLKSESLVKGISGLARRKTPPIFPYITSKHPGKSWSPKRLTR